VLITSRNTLWPPGQAVTVPVLDRSVAAEFLADRTQDPDDQAATGLADEVGGLPLALEQAAAYVQVTSETLAGYLAAFQRGRASLLARGVPTRYTGTVVTTWALTFSQLEQSNPSAAGLLRLLAFFASDAVPLGLLLRSRPGLTEQLPAEVAPVLVPLLEDELAAGEAVSALHDYSLARQVGDGTVSVHQLVQAVTADQMPDELRGMWRQAAAALVEAALPGNPAQHNTWPLFAALLPHAQAAFAPDSNGMALVASYLGHSGSYVAAREFWRGVLEERVRNLGPENPATLPALVQVAYCTGKAGDAAGARDRFAALLPIEERVLGHEHPETLAVRAGLARWTEEAGDIAGARDRFAALLPVRERVSDPSTRIP
jgi:hypothetical protein